jgi:hypothetical protein
MEGFDVNSFLEDLLIWCYQSKIITIGGGGGVKDMDSDNNNNNNNNNIVGKGKVTIKY